MAIVSTHSSRICEKEVYQIPIDNRVHPVCNGILTAVTFENNGAVRFFFVFF